MKKFIAMALTVMLFGCATSFAESAPKQNRATVSTESNEPAHKQYMGGSFSLWYEAGQDGSDGAFTAAVVPTYGWNFNNKWGAGVALGYERTFREETTTNWFVCRPYARWTYLHANKFHLFLDGGFSLMTGSVSYSGGGTSNGSLVFKVGITPGFLFDLNDNFSLQVHLGFLGGQAANDIARAAGYSRGGGLQLTLNTLDFGLYYNF